MNWLVICPHCRQTLTVYLEDADGMPFSTPLHYRTGGQARCPGSGTPLGDGPRQAPD